VREVRVGAERDGLHAKLLERPVFRCDRSEFGGSNKGERRWEEADKPPLTIEVRQAHMDDVFADLSIAEERLAPSSRSPRASTQLPE